MMMFQPLFADDAPAVAPMCQAACAHQDEKLRPETGPMFDAMVEFLAAEQSVNAIGEFLRQRLSNASASISTSLEV